MTITTRRKISRLKELERIKKKKLEEAHQKKQLRDIIRRVKELILAP